MSRKALLVVLGLAASPVGSWATDERFLRMWETAQKQRPAQLVSSARIAPEGEPGTPMVVRPLRARAHRAGRRAGGVHAPGPAPRGFLTLYLPSRTGWSFTGCT